jgi:hypothetical protein
MPLPLMICYLDLAARNTAVIILAAGAISGFKFPCYRFATGDQRSQRWYRWCMRSMDNLYKLRVR